MQSKVVIVGLIVLLLGAFLWSLHGRYYVVTGARGTAYEIDRWTGRTWFLCAYRAKRLIESEHSPSGSGRWIVDWLGVIWFLAGASMGMSLTCAVVAWKQRREKQASAASDRQ